MLIRIQDLDHFKGGGLEKFSEKNLSFIKGSSWTV